MHVYLREEPVAMRMNEVDPEGLVPEDSELVAVAFYIDSNDRPSFRALLPPETVEVLAEAVQLPVQLGLLAEEPESADAEIHAMVGLSVIVPDELAEELGGEEPTGAREAWQSDDAGAWHPDGWKEEPAGDSEMPRTALLAFAPLVRLRRRFPDNFGEELADLLESALSGATRPNLEARVDSMLDDL
jgi:hypothetical protein